MKRLLLLLTFLFLGVAFAVQTAAKSGVLVYHPAQGVQSVQDDANSVHVYPITTLINHATLIQVPFEVSKAWCGDLQRWTLQGEANYVSVKPLASGLSTNLHILTTNGRMYSFRLTSTSSSTKYTDVFQIKNNTGYQVNLDKLVQEKVAAAEQKLRREYDAKLAKAIDENQNQVSKRYAKQTYTDYKWNKGDTFQVDKVYNDKAFTYIVVKGDEKPALYLETKDGWKWKRELVNFTVTSQNLFRVQKILQGERQRFVLQLRNDQVTIKRDPQNV